MLRTLLVLAAGAGALASALLQGPYHTPLTLLCISLLGATVGFTEPTQPRRPNRPHHSHTLEPVHLEATGETVGWVCVAADCDHAEHAAGW